MTESALRPAVIAVLTPAAEDDETPSIVSALMPDGDWPGAIDLAGDYVLEQGSYGDIVPAALEWWHLGAPALDNVPVVTIHPLYALNDPEHTGDIVGVRAEFAEGIAGDYEGDFRDVRQAITAACDEYTVIRTAELLGTYLGPGEVTLPEEEQ